MTHIPSAGFEHVQDVIRTAFRLESDWLQKVTQDEMEKPRFTPWMPLPLPQWDGLMLEAYPALAGDRFLDIGCGPGSKMLIAQENYHLACIGFDRVPEYVQAAAEIGLDATVADAMDWPDYGAFDLLWFNRPYRDPALQSQLEQRVWEQVTPGAVVICANLTGPPPGWFPILDAWQDTQTGIWLKLPGNLPESFQRRAAA